MDTQLLISGVIFGLSIGSIYFLMAIGLSLCFGLMRIISLDQLLYYSIGAYITYAVSLYTGSMWLGALGGLVVAGILSFAVERFIFLRIYERDIAFTHDHLLRDPDRRRRHHQGDLGARSPPGDDAGHDPDGRSWAPRSPSTG